VTNCNDVACIPATQSSISSVGNVTHLCDGESLVLSVSTDLSTYDIQWKLNGAPIPSATSSTYTASLGGIYTVVISDPDDGTCAYESVVGESLTLVSNSSVVPNVSILTDVNTVCSNTEVKFIAKPVNAGVGSYRWFVGGIEQLETSDIFIYIPANGDIVKVEMTTGLTCVATSTANANPVTMIVNSLVSPTAIITVDKPTICPGEEVIFTAELTNEGTPVYDWLLNDVSTGITTATYSSTVLSDNDKVQLKMTSDVACAVFSIVDSNEEEISVGAAVVPSVSISANVNSNTVCSGTDVEFTAVPVNGGDAIYKWFVGTVEQLETSAIFTYTPSNGEVMKCQMTTGLTCVTTSIANANPVTMIVNSSISPIVSISESVNNICEGVNVVFIATPTNAGITPVYDWLLNNISTGEISGNYSSMAIKNGDKVKVILTSSDACASGRGTSSEVIMVVNSTVTPTAIITADKPTICPGEEVIFSAELTNEGTPIYDWLLNDVSTGIRTATYSSRDFNNNDKVKLEITSDALCTTSNIVPSDNVTIEVGGPVTPTVSISTDVNTVCTGTEVEFTAAPVNGGIPIYKWFVGTEEQSETADIFTYTPSNGDIVKVEMTTGLTCVTTSTANADPVTMIVNSSISPLVSISESGNNICEGENVTFTAKPINGGTSPVYDWLLNNVSTGITTVTYSSLNFNNNDKVKVVMTSDEVCATSPVANSTEITVSVTSSGGTPTLELKPLKNPICIDDNFEVLASSSLGHLVRYEWSINDIKQTDEESFFSRDLVNEGDIITVVISISSTCITTSQKASVVVYVEEYESLQFSPEEIDICSDKVPVLLTVSNLSASDYVWTLNGEDILSSNNLTYTASKSGEYGIKVNSLVCGVIPYPGISVDITEVQVVSAGEDMGLKQRNSTLLNGEVSEGEIVWSPVTYLDDVNIENPEVSTNSNSDLGEVIYTITATNGKCAASDEMVLTIYKDLKVYSAFSPNGDGVNEVWTISGIDKYPDAAVKVFNRWGQQVFISYGYKTPWDGSYNGKELPMATYYYIIELNDSKTEQPSMEGSVTIVR